MIHIEEFILRMPGLSEEDAHSVAREVAISISDGLSTRQLDRHIIGTLDLKVAIPQGASHCRMATLIAESILKVLE